MPSAFDPNHPSLQESDPIPVKARSDWALVVDARVAMQPDCPPAGMQAAGTAWMVPAAAGTPWTCW